MSNPEAQSSETVCAPGPARLEILEPRDVPLGGLRAMNVRRTLPQRGRTLIGAWCFLDHYGPDEVAESGGMNVPAHPHIGLQTVSWLFSGEIEHRDSAGFHAVVRPGELNLMTAGRGISHSERSTPGTTVLHGAQLWVALPSHARTTPKTFEHYVPPVLSGAGAGVGTGTGTGWTVQVFLGSLLGHSSPVSTHTELVGAEIVLDPGCELVLDVAQAHEHGILVDSGSVTVGSDGAAGQDSTAEPDSIAGPNSAVAANQLAFLPAGASTLRIIAGADGARLLLIGGEPLGEDLVMWWNFVGRDHAEIVQARADWQAELAAAGVHDVAVEGLSGTDTDAGSGSHPAPTGSPTESPTGSPTESPSDRFGLPSGEPEPPLSAPPAPIAKLLPRR